MIKRKFIPFIDTFSLLVLFFLGIIFNLYGSLPLEHFFIIAISLSFLGALISMFFGDTNLIKTFSSMHLLIMTIYIILIIVLLNILFGFNQLNNISYIVDRYIFLISFLILFLLSLREIFLIIYSRNPVG